MKLYGLKLTQIIRYFYSRNQSVSQIANILNRLGVKYSIGTVKTQGSLYRRNLAKLDFTPTASQKEALDSLIDNPSAPPPEVKLVQNDDKEEEIETIIPDETETDLSKINHKTFKELLIFCKARVNVWLVGPAGSGKTTAAQRIADEMGLPFYFNGAIDSEYKLLGFIDAQGRVINKPFRKAFEHGGVYLFDEIDASLPGAVLAFNAALANGRCDFPDGEVIAHKDFICIAAANTFDGTGEFVGRLKQDAAFLDRFAQLVWGYDENLERRIAPSSSFTAEWVTLVQTCRANAKRHGLRVTISPRATIAGIKLLKEGLSQAATIKACIKKGMNDEQLKLVTENVRWIASK